MTSAANRKEAASRPARVIASLFTVVAATAYSAISVYRHDHFGSMAYDLGIQDQTVWGYSRFEFIYNTVLGIPNLLGDHFHPILMVLAPLMWIWNSAAVLLVAQGVILAAASIPIYLWSARELGPLAGLAFQAAYLCFWGVLAGVVFDFHHIVFGVLAISVALYGTLVRRNAVLWPAVAIAMLTREDMSLTLMALGLYVAVAQRRWLLGAALIGINAAWFSLLLLWVMPALGGGVPYRHWLYDALGTGPLTAAAYVLRHPIASLELLFNPLSKVRVWIGSFGAFAFLPLISPVVIVAIPSFLERFWSSSPDLWSFHFQYSLLPAPILTFAAIDSCARLKRLLAGRLGGVASNALPLAAAGASAVLTFALVKPYAELSTLLPDAQVAQIQSCLQTIPPGASVLATDNLVPHLSHRAQIYVTGQPFAAEYIALDASGGFLITDKQLREIVLGSMAAGYGAVCAKGTVLVLERDSPNGQLTPELGRWLAGDCSGTACAAGTGVPPSR